MTSVYQATIERHSNKCRAHLERSLQSAITFRAKRPSPELQERIDALQHLIAIRPVKRPKPTRMSCHKPPRPFARWQPVIDDCCARHGVSRRELFLGFKDSRVIPCRFEIWWTLHRVHGVPLTRIGERMGGFHHTSVLHGVRQWQSRLDAESQEDKVAA